MVNEMLIVSTDYAGYEASALYAKIKLEIQLAMFVEVHMLYLADY